MLLHGGGWRLLASVLPTFCLTISQLNTNFRSTQPPCETQGGIVGAAAHGRITFPGPLSQCLFLLPLQYRILDACALAVPVAPKTLHFGSQPRLGVDEGDAESHPKAMRPRPRRRLGRRKTSSRGSSAPFDGLDFCPKLDGRSGGSGDRDDDAPILLLLTAHYVGYSGVLSGGSLLQWVQRLEIRRASVPASPCVQSPAL